MIPAFLTILQVMFLTRFSASFIMGAQRRSFRNRLLPLRTSSITTTPDSSNAKVVVKRSRQSMEFRKGSQLVFQGAVSYTTGGEEPPQMADLVQVLVEQEKKKSSKKGAKNMYKHVSSPTTTTETQSLGWGVYNPKSLYRVRLLCHTNLQPALSNELVTLDSHNRLRLILENKISTALATRKAVGLPNTETDTYRLINGEGDGLSGLAVDILGGKVAVIMSSATWCQIHQTTIQTALKEILPSDFIIVWKTTPNRLKQDGWVEADDQRREEQVAENVDESIIVRESGVSYMTFPLHGQGQKTGFYCDQRDNRKHLASLCSGKRVLDLCCYHGGFSLTAKLLGGASHCTGVDSSQGAIDICNKNSKLNGLEDDIFFEKGDISKFMQEKAAQKQCWDVIVLDPPKLAPSVSGLDRASRKYHSFNRDAIALINQDEGGLLLTCTCSAAMTQKNGGQYFLEVVQKAATSAGRSITLLQTSGAAPCHTQSPASYPAGAYLTAALFYVAPTTMTLVKNEDKTKLT